MSKIDFNLVKNMAIMPFESFTKKWPYLFVNFPQINIWWHRDAALHRVQHGQKVYDDGEVLHEDIGQRVGDDHLLVPGPVCGGVHTRLAARLYPLHRALLPHLQGHGWVIYIFCYKTQTFCFWILALNTGFPRNAFTCMTFLLYRFGFVLFFTVTSLSFSLTYFLVP